MEVEVGERIREETGVSLGQSGDSKARGQGLHAGRVGTSEDEDSEWEAESHPQGDAELTPR